MRVIADFHIHSYLSRATSKSMRIDELSENGKLKGLDLIGTGDFTHPVWFAHIKEKLKARETANGSGIFNFKGMNWVLTGEIATIYYEGGKSRRVHHVLHAPSFDVAKQINEAFSKRSNLEADGRPILKTPSPELVEILMEISKDILIYPAHAWTSWYGVIGEFSGFDTLEDCYHDQIKHIHALETGMSSDPIMNWRISGLDKFTLLSNSDSHSPWVWRIGREANVFELGRLTYNNIHDAIKKRDPKRLKFTIEVEPSYGKYHFTGHRACGINIHPKEALKTDNLCRVCGRKLTVGVLQRVEKLADREEGFKPRGAIPFKSLLPLYEIVSHAMGVNQLYSKRVIALQDALIQRFGNEFEVLLNASEKDLLKATNEKIVDGIIKTREGKAKYIPGYDGVYGIPVFTDEEYSKLKKRQVSKAKEQRSLKDFKK
jgi:uncharacterized protein (TIGR00375 family)